MEHSVSSRTGERSRPALLVSAALALLVALTTLLAPGLASTASAADVIKSRVLPTISGTAGVGETLTVDKGVWSPTDVTLSVQWLRGATAIENATGDTYSPVAADAGQKLAVRVTASKTDSTPVSATSVQTAAVADCTGLNALVCGLNPAAQAKKSPTNSAVPTIAGTAQVGTKLTATPGTWSSGACTTQTCKYQWYAGAAPIDGANGLELTPTAAEQGKTLTIKEWATSADGLSGSVSSAATAAVAEDPRQPWQNTALPAITNKNPTVGDTLLANPGTWTPADNNRQYEYQWLLDGVAAAASPGLFPFQFKITDAMVGKKVSVRVTALASETSAAATATSTATEPVRASGTPGTPGTSKDEPAMTVNVKVKRSGKVVVKAKVTAAGHSPVTGQAKVKVTRGGGKAVTVDLINGKVKLSWLKLKKGKHKAKVTYLGNDKLAPTATVVVPFTKR